MLLLSYYSIIPLFYLVTLLFYYLLFHSILLSSCYSIIYYSTIPLILFIILLSSNLLLFFYSSISYPALLFNIFRLQLRSIYFSLCTYFSTSFGKLFKRENSLLNKLLYQIFKINNKLNSLSRIKSCSNLVDKRNLF